MGKEKQKSGKKENKKGLIERLEKKSKEIRRAVLEMTTAAGSGHPGGSLSATDLAVALYYHQMRLNPKEPCWPDRDRFVLSKGHCAPLLYAVLADKGYFGKEQLGSLRKINCCLQGHPCVATPGVEICTGSLGQGLSVANGMALAAKIDGKQYRVFCLLGDGEIQEGQIWEAAMTASHFKLNTIALLDHNSLQIDGRVEEVMDIHPIEEKWKAFGWNVLAINGHNFEQLFSALEKAVREKEKPTVIIAETIKGKGVSFMHGKKEFHGKTLSKEELEKALKELA